jgi:hypothetical protein
LGKWYGHGLHCNEVCSKWKYMQKSYSTVAILKAKHFLTILNSAATNDTMLRMKKKN